MTKRTAKVLESPNGMYYSVWCYAGDTLFINPNGDIYNTLEEAKQVADKWVSTLKTPIPKIVYECTSS